MLTADEKKALDSQLQESGTRDWIIDGITIPCDKMVKLRMRSGGSYFGTIREVLNAHVHLFHTDQGVFYPGVPRVESHKYVRLDAIECIELDIHVD
jgi:hypothetical protein